MVIAHKEAITDMRFCRTHQKSFAILLANLIIMPVGVLLLDSQGINEEMILNRTSLAVHPRGRKMISLLRGGK